MKKGTLQKLLAIIAAAALCIATLASCAEGGSENDSSDTELTATNSLPSDSETITETNTAENSTDANTNIADSPGAEANLNIPSAYYYRFNTAGSGSHSITRLDESTSSQTSSYSLNGADKFSIIGPFREGYAFAEWDTSDYDEEWDEETNQLHHFGCVDPSGEIVLDLTDLLAGSDGKVQNVPFFSNGKAVIVIPVEQGAISLEEEFKTVCIDTSGKTLWEVAGMADWENHAFYENDVVTFTDGGGQNEQNGKAVNESGEIVFDPSEEMSFDTFYNAGKGLIGVDDGDSITIVDYSGNVVLDPATRFTDYSEAAIDTHRGQPGYSLVRLGTAVVNLTQVSPNGTGNTKDYMGLWSISEEKWLIEPIEGCTSGEIIGPDLVCFEVSAGAGDDWHLENQLYSLDGQPIKLPDGTNIWQGYSHQAVYIDNGWYFIRAGSGTIGVPDNEGFIHINNGTVDSLADIDDPELHPATNSFYR